MNIDDLQPEDDVRPPWSRWYREAREEAAFRYGLTGVPVDEYKEGWICCESVPQAVRNIAKKRGLAGGR